MLQRHSTHRTISHTAHTISRYIRNHATHLKRRGGIGFMVGILIACSLPQTYTAEVVTVPKSTWNRRSVTRNDMVRTLLSGESVISNPDPDCFTPKHYAYILHSTPYLRELMDLPVRMHSDSTTLTLGTYVNQHQRIAWWNYLLAAPSYVRYVVTGGPWKEKKDPDRQHPLHDHPLYLSKAELRTARRIGQAIRVKDEAASFSVTFRIRLQDPMVAALTAQAVVDHLQQYLQTYRDRKAQLNLAYCDSLFRQARREYYTAQEAEAAYRDTHRHLHGYTAREPQRRLALLRQEAYRHYVATEQSLREAQERVAAVTPLFTVITPAEVPLHPDGPARPWVVLTCTLLGAASLPLGTGIARHLRRLRYWKRRRPAHRSRPMNPASAPTATEPALNPTAR